LTADTIGETVRIAFIGLGVMGLPMASNLADAGNAVVGFNRSRPAVDALVGRGGSAAASIADAVAEADIVITMLPDSPDVVDVYTGPGGIFASARAGTLLIDMSTIRPDVAETLHEAAAAASFPLLDAPVSGGQRGAEDGVLSIMCGGSDEAFDRALPVLRVMGGTVIRVGGPGSGQTVKAANQLLVAGIIELVSEALVFLDAHEVALGPAVEVLNGGLAGNTVLTRKGAQMLAGDFTPGFRVELHHKDLGIYREAARGKNVFSPLGALMGELMNSLRSTGGAQLDHGALLAQVDELSGRARWSRRER
jgi:2-hydroxy-3-oxopropionate reductase